MKKFTFIFLAFYLCLAHLHAIIIEAPNLDEFEKFIKDVDQETLVLFDINETLIISQDLILRPCAKSLWSRYAKETLENPEVAVSGKHNRKYFLGQILSKIEYELIDPKFVTIIHSLQERKIKTIALTRMRSGSLEAISSLEDWRIEHLKKHDIDFSLAFPQHPEVIVKKNLEAHGGNFPLFKQGVLCTNKEAKGPVLMAFLECIQWVPSKVVLVDNNTAYLKSVEKSLEEAGIHFIGFHYTAVENLPCVINEDLAKFQLTHLAKTGIWLTDDEALNLMGSN